jgi:hypothetical protein
MHNWRRTDCKTHFREGIIMCYYRRCAGRIAITIVIGFAALFQACCTGTVYESRLIPVREVTERIEAELPLNSDRIDALVGFVEADARSDLREVLDLFDENATSNLMVYNFDNNTLIKEALGSKPVSTDVVNSCDEYEPDENTRRAYDVGRYVLILSIEETEYPNDGGLIPDSARVFSRLIIQKSFSGEGQK